MDLHAEAARGLAGIDQRYTTGRRAIVDTLAAAGRPLTVPELIGAAERSIPASSAYRNVMVLVEAGVLHRVAGTDDHGRFELAEPLGDHHHHLICDQCGKVEDIDALPRLERAVSAAAEVAADETGFQVRAHRIDLVGQCRDCR
jgi:Fur family ferric uptake transcriptional regulator